MTRTRICAQLHMFAHDQDVFGLVVIEEVETVEVNYVLGPV